jgi:hypothetical protein
VNRAANRAAERSRWAAPVVLAVLCLAASVGIWKPLPLAGHSVDIDAHRLLVFDSALRAGEAYPRWVSDFYYGHGSPVFHYYAPLPFYLCEVPLLLGATVPYALKVTLVLTWLLSGLGMYLLARDYLSRPGAVVAGAFYMLAPYRLVDILVRHALAEHVAFAWLPLAVWGVVGCARTPGIARFLMGALAVAALLLTHNITAMIFMPVLAVWWAVEAYRSGSVKAAAGGALAAVSGLMLSAFFWLPAFIDKALVHAHEALTEGYYAYSRHFVHFPQLFLPAWGFGGSQEGIADDQLSFQIGLAHWLWVVVALAGLVWIRTRSDRPEAGRLMRDASPALAVFVGAILMALPLSSPVWDRIPLLAFVQFPWRFLMFATFGAALFSGFAVDAWGGRKVDRGVVLAAIAVLSAALAYAPITRPMFRVYDSHARRAVYGDYRTLAALLSAGDRYRRFRTPLTLQELRASGASGAAEDDYLPRTVREKPTEVPSSPAAVEGGAVIETRRLEANRYRLWVRMNQDGRVSLNQFYFPGWAATVDATPVRVAAEEGRGRVVVPVAEGEHDVEVYFGSTPLRRAAGAVSGVGVFSLLLAAAWSVWNRARIPARRFR